MRNIFCGKKMYFAFGLIAGAVLMLLLTFAVPEKRTFVGWDLSTKIAERREIKMPKSIGPEETIKRMREREKRLEGIEPYRAEKRVEEVVFAKEVQARQDVPAVRETAPAMREMKVPEITFPKELEKREPGKEKTAVTAEKKEPSPSHTMNVITNEDILKYYEKNQEYMKK